MHKRSWLLILPLILLVMILAGFWLDKDGFWYDEVYTVKNAGGAQYGPLSPAEIYATVQADDPYQAIGYPLFVAAWGAVAGWSEYALRVSSFLFTLIGLALSYRLGKEVHSSEAGLFAALIYSLSSFTIFYAHELRAFSMTAAFSAWLIWAYLRLLKRPDNGTKLGFFLAGAALLYVHYYAAMLLIALGIYHLIFAKKDRLWLEITGLAVLMGVAFLPQVPAFLEGFNRYDPANVSEAPLSAWGAILSIFYYLGNANWPFVVLGLIPAIAYAFRDKIESYRALLIITLFGTIILLVSNEFLDILEPKRLRYAIYLWPLLAVILGMGMISFVRQQAPKLHRPLFTLLPLVWIGTSLIVYFIPHFNASYEGTETPRFRTITNVMREEGASTDLFTFYNGKSNHAWYVLFTFNYSVYDLPMPSLLTASLYNNDESISSWAWQQVDAVQRLWYGQNRTIEVNNVHEDFVTYLSENFVQCGVYVDDADLGLELYARSQAFCPGDGRFWMGFGVEGPSATNSIDYEFSYNLLEYELIEGDTLRLNMGWETRWDSDVIIPSDTYNLAVHITGEGSDVPVLQTDVPFSNAHFQPMALSFDMSQLPAGEYRVWLIVYDWRNGTRLMGMGGDGETGDRLLLGTINR